MTKAIILSGGYGTRLRPLSCSLPKSLMPIVNKPVMERQILLLKSAGVREIVLAVSVMDDIVKNYFRDGSQLGVKIHYTEEKRPLGTAGAIKIAEPYLGEENFFMVNGDVILNCDLNKMLSFHTIKKSIGTIAGKVVDDPSQYGVLIENESTHQLLEFLEKDEYSPPNGKIVPMPINAGIYILEPEIFTYIEPQEKVSIERQVFPNVVKKEQMFHYQINGVWKDIGKPYDLLEGNMLLMVDLIKNLGSKAENLIDPSANIHPDSRIYSPTTIGENVVIRSGCTIGPNVIVGNNVIIENNVEIRDCVIYNNTNISSSVKIERAIIADNCQIQKNVILKGNNQNLVILASFVEVLNDLEIIAPETISLTVCHHEVVKESMK
ncbi:MAG: NDP-sugar synthase [Candidatus Lokiarchaeota archaeon]|nr:NDP-sugar synthase [Candidatus Lokiarchaeota archaeon]